MALGIRPKTMMRSPARSPAHLSVYMSTPSASPTKEETISSSRKRSRSVTSEYCRGRGRSQAMMSPPPTPVPLIKDDPPAACLAQTRSIATMWAKRAVRKKYLHMMASQWYDKLSKYLSTPVAFFVAGIGTGLVGLAAGDPASTAGQVVMWTLAALSFLTAGISAVNWDLDPSKLSERHLQKSAYWMSIADDLVLDISRNENVVMHTSFLEHVQRHMTLADNMSPVLPAWVFLVKDEDVVYGTMAKEMLDIDAHFSALASETAPGDEDDDDLTKRLRDIARRDKEMYHVFGPNRTIVIVDSTSSV